MTKQKKTLATKKKRCALPVEPIAQEEDSTCGPASLRMILNSFGRTYCGKPYSEKRLAKLSECGDEGTDHAKIIRAAKACGANVFSKENGTIAEIRRFVCKERLPVLIGWWSGPERTEAEIQANHDLDEGHYSVIINVTATHVWVADPWIWEKEGMKEEGAGIRRIPIRKFMQMWHDTDMSDYLAMKRWYMVLNFEGKSFRIPGGANY